MDAMLELQGVITSTVKGQSPQLAGGRIYDRVPEDVAFPYISFGPSDAINDDAECIQADEITFQIDVWSRTPGFPEVKQLARDLRNLLLGANIQLTSNALVTLEHSSTRVFRDPDGLTSHAAMTFTAVIEEP